MNRWCLPIAIGLFGLSLLPGCEENSSPGPNGPTSETKQVTVEVSGMACAKGCAPRVHDALASLPWVKNVRVSFESKKAIFLAETARFDAKAINQVLQDAGFEGRLRD